MDSLMQTSNDLNIQFGKYNLYAKLAVGGMAELFLAKQAGIGGFNRTIVLKCILPHLAKEHQFITMFLDEARIASHLNHPNIVQIYEVGQTDDIHFIAMEYIRGRDLKTFRRRLYRHLGEASPPPYPLIASVIAQAAAGLQYAHNAHDENGNPLEIVHRDVSPQNLLLSYSGMVKLVDFGVAKAATQEHKTSAGTVKGKYRYMSPEQLAGKPLDARSDLFALGIVLYELTTNTNLFKRPTEVETIQAITFAQIIPPSKRIKSYPPFLERIVMKALNRDKDKRYQTSESFRQDLEQFILQQGVYQANHQLRDWMEALFANEIEEGHSRVSQPLSQTDLFRLVGKKANHPSIASSFRDASFHGTGTTGSQINQNPGSFAYTGEQNEDQTTPSGKINPPPKEKNWTVILLGLFLLLFTGSLVTYALWTLFGAPSRHIHTRTLPRQASKKPVKVAIKPIKRTPNPYTPEAKFEHGLKNLKELISGQFYEEAQIQTRLLEKRFKKVKDPDLRLRYNAELKRARRFLRCIKHLKKAKRYFKKHRYVKADKQLASLFKVDPDFSLAEPLQQKIQIELKKRNLKIQAKRPKRRKPKHRKPKHRKPKRRQPKIRENRKPFKPITTLIIPPSRPKIETKGLLFVNSFPIGASIRIKSKMVGFTPLNKHKLQQGRYTLLLQRKGYLPQRKMLQIRSGKSTYIKFDLVKIAVKKPSARTKLIPKKAQRPQPKLSFQQVRLPRSKRLHIFLSDPRGHIGRQSTSQHRLLCRKIERETARLLGSKFSVSGITKPWQVYIRRRMKIDYALFYPRAVAYVIYKNLARGRSKSRIGQLLVSYHKQSRFRRIKN